MKITRAQKDAVISLLKEKFDEKKKIALEKFKEENKNKIENKYVILIDSFKKVIDFWKSYRNAYAEFDAVVKLLKDDNKWLNYYKFNGGNVAGAFSDVEAFVNEIAANIAPKIDSPDYNKVERQLELDSLSKDFNLDEFLKKYLQD